MLLRQIMTYIDNTPRVFPAPNSLSFSVGGFDESIRTDDREGDATLQASDLLLVLLLEDERTLVREVVDLDTGLRYLSHYLGIIGKNNYLHLRIIRF